MTKEEFIDFVKVQTGDKHHETVIEKAIASAWNTILYNTFKNNPDNLDLYTKEYKIATGSILQNANTSIWYFLLPAQISQLPTSEQLREVRPLTDVQNTFGIISLSQRTTLNNLQSIDISEKRTTCCVRGNTVEFDNISAANRSAGVLANLVVSFEEYADTDDIYVPSGQDIDLLGLTKSFLEGTPPEIKVDNNTVKRN